MKHQALASTIVLVIAAQALGQNNHEIVRNRSTFQTGPSTLTPLQFQGVLSVRWNDPDAVTSTTAATDDGLFEFDLERTAPDSDRFEFKTGDLNSIEDLEATIPYGAYNLTLSRESQPDLFATLSDGTPRYTNVPLFNNFASFAAVDATQDFFVGWDAMVGGNALSLQIFGPDGFYYVQQLPVTSTGTVIPADTLLPDLQYTFSLVFGNFQIVDDDGFDGSSVGQSFYQHFTQAEFLTVPAPGTAGMLALAGLAAARRRR